MKAKISKWYRHGLWTTEMVRSAVLKNVISEDDYREITGEDYSA